MILRILRTVFFCSQQTHLSLNNMKNGHIYKPSCVNLAHPSGFLYEGEKSALSSFFVTNLQFTHSVWLFLVTKSVIFRRYSSGAKGDKSSEETKSFYKSLLVLLWLTSLWELSDFLFRQQSASFSEDKGVDLSDEPSWDDENDFNIDPEYVWHNSKAIVGSPERSKRMRSHHFFTRRKDSFMGLNSGKSQNGPPPSHWCHCHGVGSQGRVANRWRDHTGCSETKLAEQFLMVSFDSAALRSIGECLECRVTDTFTSAPDAFGEQRLVQFRRIRRPKAERRETNWSFILGCRVQPRPDLHQLISDWSPASLLGPPDLFWLQISLCLRNLWDRGERTNVASVSRYFGGKPGKLLKLDSHKSRSRIRNMSDFREMSKAGKEGCKCFLWFNLLKRTFNFVLKNTD